MTGYFCFVKDLTVRTRIRRRTRSLQNGRFLCKFHQISLVEFVQKLATPKVDFLVGHRRRECGRFVFGLEEALVESGQRKTSFVYEWALDKFHSLKASIHVPNVCAYQLTFPFIHYSETSISYFSHSFFRVWSGRNWSTC